MGVENHEAYSFNLRKIKNYLPDIVVVHSIKHKWDGYQIISKINTSVIHVFIFCL